MAESRANAVTVKAFVKTPSLPNFLALCDTDRRIDVADVDDETLRRIGAMWTKMLLEHAAKRRVKREAGDV